MRLFTLFTALAVLLYMPSPVMAFSLFAHETAVKKALQHSITHRNKLLADLAVLETKAGKTAKSLTKTKHHIYSNKQQQKHLNRQQHRLQTQLEQQIKQLKRSLQTSYLWLKQPQLKLLLSNHSHIQRLIAYHQAITAQQQDNVTRLQIIQQQLIDNATKLAHQAHQLTVLLHQQQHALLTLTQTEQSRRSIITSLEHTIANQRQDLLDAQQRLAAKLRSLTPLNHGHFKPIMFHLGHLPWPTDGKVISSFGQMYHHTHLKQHGIVIAARLGHPVHAIANGEVVFSKWLPGYGFLIILDHHNGYLSLYGRNRYLNKQSGDWVNTHDTIAVVGNSGGYATPGLYFELRQGATPIDPIAWLTPHSHRYARRHS